MNDSHVAWRAPPVERIHALDSLACAPASARSMSPAARDLTTAFAKQVGTTVFVILSDINAAYAR